MYIYISHTKMLFKISIWFKKRKPQNDKDYNDFMSSLALFFYSYLLINTKNQCRKK